MPARLDHTVVNSTNRFEAARFLTDLLGAPEPEANGPFAAVRLENGVTIDYADHIVPPEKIASQHFAYLVSEEEFDGILARVQERGLTYWADPYHTKPNEVNHLNGARAFYVNDPDEHNLEFFTAMH
ncbi:VOC family protein [Streptomyces orinoci]|uniref:VOC family protein n=1 Tax=Streptomyces orinoci TaxID=67339 RepID=A0ABV3JSY5_STRON|nr:VOC family protein [Streptomyces orinoci]